MALCPASVTLEGREEEGIVRSERMFEALPHWRRGSARHPSLVPSDRGRLALPHRGTPLSNPDPPVGTEVPAVTFEAVSLAFDDNVVLREISFSVRPGHTTILLGASGSGKSVRTETDPRLVEA